MEASIYEVIKMEYLQSKIFIKMQLPTTTQVIYDALEEVDAKLSIDEEEAKQKTVALTLPTSNQECRNVMKELGVVSMNECVCYEFTSKISQLSEIFEDMGDLEDLNNLTINIENMEECNDLIKYKVMLTSESKWREIHKRYR